MGILAVLAVAFTLVGCATTERQPVVQDLPYRSAPVPADRARITVFRATPEPHPVTSGGPLKDRAAVLVDGVAASTLGAGEFHVRDLPPGPHRLRVELANLPAACEQSLELAGGSESFYLVAPRPSYWIAMVPGQTLAVITSVPLPPYSLVGGALGFLMATGAAAAESAGKACGGPFSIVPAETGEAMRKLADLRASPDAATREGPAAR